MRRGQVMTCLHVLPLSHISSSLIIFFLTFWLLVSMAFTSFLKLAVSLKENIPQMLDFYMLKDFGWVFTPLVRHECAKVEMQLKSAFMFILFNLAWRIRVKCILICQCWVLFQFTFSPRVLLFNWNTSQTYPFCFIQHLHRCGHLLHLFECLSWQSVIGSI